VSAPTRTSSYRRLSAHLRLPSSWMPPGFGRTGHSPHRTVHATLTAHGSPGVSLPHGGLLYRLGHQVPVPRLPLEGFARDAPHCCGSYVLLNVNSLAPFPLWLAFPTSEYYGASEAPDKGLRSPRALACRSPSDPFGSFPCSRSWTPATSDRWRLPTIPSAYGGSPPRCRVTQVNLPLPFPPQWSKGGTASTPNAVAVL